MVEPITKSGLCSGCGDTSIAVLYRQIHQNGAEAFTWVCLTCKRKAPFGGPVFIAHEKVESYLTEEQLENLPVLVASLYARCQVCGSRGAEEHHWAPKGIFGAEAERWPKDYLCKACHDRWHRMVTPQLVQ